MITSELFADQEAKLHGIITMVPLSGLPEEVQATVIERATAQLARIERLRKLEADTMVSATYWATQFICGFAFGFALTHAAAYALMFVAATTGSVTLGALSVIAITFVAGWLAVTNAGRVDEFCLWLTEKVAAGVAVVSKALSDAWTWLRGLFNTSLPVVEDEPAPAVVAKPRGKKAVAA